METTTTTLASTSTQPSGQPIQMFDCMIHLMPNKMWYKKFMVKPIKGKEYKGVSLSAAKNIAKGEIILTECPIFTLPFDRDHMAVTGGLMACNSEYKRMFYDMFNCHDETSKMTREMGIFATNGIPCGTDFGSGRVADREGVFVISARINHSCVPNVHGQWVDWVQQIEQRATREIKNKEEICRGYIDLLKPRAERQKELLAKYWFKCDCPACKLTGAELEASDARRKKIRELLDKHHDGKCTDATQGLEEIRLALDCIEKEGLPMYESIFYFFAFHLCAASSDYPNAREWAKKARDSHLMFCGPTLEDLYNRLIADPGCYPDADSMTGRTLWGPT
ncbi:hypothetical protein BXZ70DRAFT_905672 [Cristinia sonorae]|uniref:SET domain-containing protein n=1 Tax=Cristinia sonorae TaxID=1940300 RepID=A0A8K0UTJ8_9AGAR|nr:hypothetical protein BXZ70DRAFT_905672 [Cristinia sonorae]